MGLLFGLKKDSLTLTFANGETSKADFYDAEISLEERGSPSNNLFPIRFGVARIINIALYFNASACPKNDPLLKAVEQVLNNNIDSIINWKIVDDDLSIEGKADFDLVEPFPDESVFLILRNREL